MDKIYLKDNYIVTELSGVTAVFGKNYTVYSENTTTFFLNSSFPINNARSVTIDFSRSSSIYNEAGIVAYTTATLRSFFLANTGFKSPSGGSGGVWGSITGTLSTQTDLQSALDAKQDDLISGTNIKTINGNTLLGSGDVAVQPTLVSATNIKTVNGNSLLGSGDLVIGGGGLTVGTTPIASGTVGRVLFQNGGNVLGQDSSLFWDNTNKRLGIGATPSTSVRLDVRAQGALSTDIAFRVRNSADTFDRLNVTGTAFSIITSSRAEMSVTANAVNFGLDNHTVTFTHSSPGQVLQTQRSNWTAMAHFATLGLTNVEALTQGSTIFGATIRAGTLTNVQNKMHFVCDSQKWGLAGVYSAGFQWYKGTQSGDAAFSTSTLASITTANRQMWLTPENSLLLTNTSGITYTTNVDSFQMYSNDIVSGNAAPHFRTENGNIIKLFQGAALTASDGTLANAVTRIAEIQARLQAHGLIA